MKRTNSRGWSRCLLLGVLALSLVLGGCSGDDGAQGPPGRDGVDGQNGLNGVDGAPGTPGSDGATGDAGQTGAPGAPGQDGQDFTTPVTAILADITSVKVPSTPAVAGTEVEFEIFDLAGRPVTELPTGASISFTFAKLTTDAAGNTAWKNYINRNATGSVSGTVVQGTTQSATAGVVNRGGGRYLYTFTNSNVSASVPFEAVLTHRIGMQVSGGGLQPCNYVHDFVPAGGGVTLTRNIAITSSCLECHQGNFGFHGGGRLEVEYCVTCHNSGSTDPDSGNTVDMANMIHKIHAGEHLPSGSYQIIGYGGSVHDYSEVRFPQSLRNCRKCHNGADSATPDGDNWKNRPTRLACGSCHDDVDFANGVNHPLPMFNDQLCSACHTASYIEEKHLTTFATANNPNVPAGLANFEYVLSKVAVTEDGSPEFTFQIRKDGGPVNFETFVAGGTNPLAGFTSGPSFYLAFSRPQDGLASVADFNNNGSSALSVSLINIWNGTQGILSGSVDGTYTALITGANYKITADAEMVTGAIIGSFTQVGGEAAANKDLNGDGDKLDDAARQAMAVMKTADGYTARRSIVDSGKCNACHEQLGTEPSFHSGARNNAQLCGFCHTPNRTSSGWAAQTKDFVHRLHAASFRTVDDVWHDMNYFLVTYPGNLQNCEACHNKGMYDFSSSVYTPGLLDSLPWSNVASGTVADNTSKSPYVPAGTYGSGFSYNLTTGVYTPAADTTLVNSPISSACFGCHDSSPAVAHMKLNGGSIYEARLTALSKVEACLVCHGPGRSAAIGEAHNPAAASGH